MNPLVISSLIKGAAELLKMNKHAHKENAVSKTTLAAIAPAMATVGALANPDALPTDPTVTQAVLALLTLILFLWRKVEK